MRSRFTAGLLASTIGASLLTIAAPLAHAGSEGGKNTTFGPGDYAAYRNNRNARRYDRNYSTRRSNGSRYRTRDMGGDFQFPDNYSSGGPSSDRGHRNGGSQYQNGKSGQLPNGGGQYQYGGGQYQSGKSDSYSTYRRGNRRYDDVRYQDRSRYRSRSRR